MHLGTELAEYLHQRLLRRRGQALQADPLLRAHHLGEQGAGCGAQGAEFEVRVWGIGFRV